MNVSTMLALLQIVGPAIARAPEFIALYQSAMDTLDLKDQATTREALADIQADNDEGHARLQAKLKAAAHR